MICPTAIWNYRHTLSRSITHSLFGIPLFMSVAFTDDCMAKFNIHNFIFRLWSAKEKIRKNVWLEFRIEFHFKMPTQTTRNRLILCCKNLIYFCNWIWPNEQADFLESFIEITCLKWLNGWSNLVAELTNPLSMGFSPGIFHSTLHWFHSLSFIQQKMVHRFCVAAKRFLRLKLIENHKII